MTVLTFDIELGNGTRSAGRRTSTLRSARAATPPARGRCSASARRTATGRCPVTPAARASATSRSSGRTPTGSTSRPTSSRSSRPSFNGAQLYAISKSALAAAATSATPPIPPVAYLDLGTIPTGDPTGSIWYSVQPATSPGQAQFDASNNGTEYFLSSLDFFGAGDNRIAAWSLTNTVSLASSTPAVTMQAPAVLSTNQWYAAPLDFGVAQQGGPRPLANYLAKAHGTPIASIEKLNANDDRMNQVVYSNGRLWAGVNTATKLPDSSAIAYFVVNAGGATFAPTVAGGGYVAIDRGSVLFPSIGVNDAGQAVMAFSV